MIITHYGERGRNYYGKQGCLSLAALSPEIQNIVRDSLTKPKIQII